MHGVVHGCLLQANAAEADVQEWHEGLREYPDLSLAPHLRRQQFRARSREIRGRVQARCGGLQILHLAENKVRAQFGVFQTLVWLCSDF